MPPPTPIPIRIEENLIYALPLAAGGMLLVDAGPDALGAWAEVQGRVASRGFAVSDVRAVLVTHAHIDHAGLAQRWALAGAQILAGAADIPALVAGRAFHEERLPLRLDTLRRHGANDDVLAVYEAGQPRRGLAWEPCAEASVHAIEDGTRIPLAEGAELRVIAVPGHTPGNLVAVIEAGDVEPRDLYAGDTLLPHEVPTSGLHYPVGPDGRVGPRWPSLPPFLRSMATLRALGSRRVLQGHGQPGAHSLRLVDRFEAHHARRRARYRALLAEQPDTALGLVERAFRFIGPLHQAAAMIEAIGHLDILAGSGEAVREEGAEGVVRHRLVG